MRITRTHLAALAVILSAGVAHEARAQARPDTTHRAARGAEQRERGERGERGERAEADEQGEHERTVPAAQVPAAARNAVSRTYANARVTKWTSEVENGRTMYEAETVEGTIHRDLLIGADGSIAEIETQVTPAQLPAAVRTAATANNARIDKAEIVVAGRDTTYEMTIHGRRGELKLRPNGTPVPAEHRAAPAASPRRP